MLVAATGLLPNVSNAHTSSVAFSRVRSAGVRMNVVTVNLNDPDIAITPAIARRGIGSCESFRSMMRRLRPTAGINGTFFDTRTLVPTGDIVIDRQLLNQGYLGVAVTISANNKVRFLPSRHPELYRWSDHDAVIVAGPTLVTEGKAVLAPRAEGFTSWVHFSPHVRAAVGLTSASKLLLVTTTRAVYLGRLARAMRALGCVEAAALDGGSSAGLYFKGKLLANPTRGMTNCLLVYDNPSEYAQRRDSFCPANQYSQARPTGS